jgi:hypothetical protein
MADRAQSIILRADRRPDAAEGEASARVPVEINKLEWILAVVAGTDLCFLPWAFGGVDSWSEWVSAGLALLALTLALIPRKRAEESLTRDGFKLAMWPRLRTFPVFWLGLVLLVQIATQGLNPAYNYQTEGERWWLIGIEHVAWLPAGLRAPFSEMNPWRALLLWGHCWLLVCALWVGITRRRTVVALLMALSLNAFVFSAFGIVQRASGAPMLYGSRAVGFGAVAAIIYKNHAGAFFGLLALVIASQVIRLFWKRKSRQLAVPLMLFFSVTALAVPLSCSISGSILFGLEVVVIVGATARSYAKTFLRRRRMLMFLVVPIVLVALPSSLVLAITYSDLRRNVELKIAGEGAYSLQSRLAAAHRGWEMFTDRWLTGWGAGCFRYGFTKYQRRDAVLLKWHDTPIRWENVHDDWLELLIEMGGFGALIVAMIIAFWVRRITRLRLWKSPSIRPLICGVMGVGVYAFFDFPLHNPAIASTVVALLPLLVRWGEGEARMEKVVQSEELIIDRD